MLLIKLTHLFNVSSVIGTRGGLVIGTFPGPRYPYSKKITRDVGINFVPIMNQTGGGGSGYPYCTNKAITH